MSVDRWKTLDLRLGWLEVFLDVAHYLDYATAGKELGLSGRQVQRTIEQLEMWLRRDLVLPGKPLTLDDLNASEFIPISIEVLELFDSCSDPDRRPPRAAYEAQRRKVRVSDLRNFLQVASYANFDSAASLADKHVSNIRDRVRYFESTLGTNLVEGRGSLQLTCAGENFVHAAEEMLGLLKRLRRSGEEAGLSLARLIYKYRMGLKTSISSWEGRKKLSAVAMDDLEKARAMLADLDKAQEMLASQFGPLPSMAAPPYRYR